MVFSSTAQPTTNQRQIPWTTVEAIRRDWNAALDAVEATDEERRGPFHEMASWLRYNGQPTPGDLARRYGVALPKVSGIISNRIYVSPPEQAKAMQLARCRAMAQERARRRRETREAARTSAD